MTPHCIMQWQHKNHNRNTQNTPHNSSKMVRYVVWFVMGYGVPFHVSIFVENWPCNYRTALYMIFHIDGLVRERCNSIANALELHLSCTNPWHNIPTQRHSYYCQSAFSEMMNKSSDNLNYLCGRANVADTQDAGSSFLHDFNWGSFSHLRSIIIRSHNILMAQNWCSGFSNCSEIWKVQQHVCWMACQIQSFIPNLICLRLCEIFLYNILSDIEMDLRLIDTLKQ